MGQIKFFNRYTGQTETEKVYGGSLVSAAYGSPLGLKFVDTLLAGPVFSKMYGLLQSSRLSRVKIDKFVKDFQIPMEEYSPGPFASFNEFFIRPFLAGRRPFVAEPSQLPAFSEGRYFGFSSLKETQSFLFNDGPALISRLCPVDYHRFHFPDDGETTTTYSIQGKLHSVNPLALSAKPDVFFTNERSVSILKTRNFGMLAYIEIGAIAVGKIVQSHKANQFKRGDEKG
jgi:phosphatidylserine decarboxylase